MNNSALIGDDALTGRVACRYEAGKKAADKKAADLAKSHPHVRDLSGRLSALRAFHSKSVLYGAFVWARRALNGPKRRQLAARRVTAGAAAAKRDAEAAAEMQQAARAFAAKQAAG